jgi:lipopolysaccharide/colanic/teichoic acid biosynthesis glycosyltransferase
MLKRIFDVAVSVITLIVLAPFFLFFSLIILIGSPGGIFFVQTRVGKDNRDFNLIKFRTMFRQSERLGLITVGELDARITWAGKWMRKYKLDELPQLVNIVKGDMSIVGPRPEVRRFVNLYNERQFEVLKVKPGLTDYASLEYSEESKLLANFSDPEKGYISEIMPAKLELNLKYIRDKSFITDLRIIIKTFKKIVRG